MIACALRAGTDIKLLRELDGCVTTESAIALLKESGLLSQAMANLGADIEETLKQHVLPDTQIGYVCFIDDLILVQNSNAEKIIDEWQENNG